MKLRQYAKLFKSKPCDPAIEWLLTQPDAETAWNNCPRGDWLWWGLRNGDTLTTKEQSVAFANRCVEAAKKYAASSAYAAAYAAYAAASSASSAYAAAYAAYAAASSAYAAAAHAAYDAADAAAAEERLAQADWIRANIPMPESWRTK